MHIEALLLDLFYGLQGKFITIFKLVNHQSEGLREQMDPGDDTDQRSADFGRDLLICVNRERGSGIAGKRMTQTGGPNGRASWSERVNLWMKKSSSVSFVISV